MTQVSGSSPIQRHHLLAIGLIVVFAIATVFLTRPQTSVTSLSPVSGLVTLKATAQSAMLYEVAIANQRPTLIEFYADWCTTCQAMAPTLQELHRQFGADINFVMLNIDDPQWREPVQQFQVNGVPHLTLLQSDQTVFDTFTGKVPHRVLVNRLTKLLA